MGNVGAGIPEIVYDFLSRRRCVVDVDGNISTEFSVPLGCVQGSVLGPKLFNVYTREIPNHLSSSSVITSYADDSYVVIWKPSGQLNDLIFETKECLTNHAN
jgi:hypothetical protein